MAAQHHTPEPEESQEVWLPVVDWEVAYEVSNRGRIRRIAEGRGTYAGKILRPYSLTKRGDNKGYELIQLCYRERREIYLIHRLEAQAFLGEAPEGQGFINHKNGIKTDNRIENLEWISRSGNAKHAIALGLMLPPPKGEGHHLSKLTNEAVREIRRTPRGYGVNIILAAKFGCTPSTIKYARAGKTWRHVE